MFRRVLGISLLMLFLVGCGASRFAEVQKSFPKMTKLSAVQVKKLIVDKPLVFNLDDGRVIELLHKADGTLSGKNIGRGVSFGGTWEVYNDGTKCIQTPRGKSCVYVYKAPDGKYYTTRPGMNKILSSFTDKN